MTTAIESFLSGRVEQGDCPSAAWVVRKGAETVSSGATGCAVVQPDRVVATLDTIYDLASLTKPLVTSFLYLLLRKELKLDPNMEARRWLPEFDASGMAEITVAHLLTHTSGLPSWLPLYARARLAGEYLLRMRERGLETKPGTHANYSCAGYIAMGELLQRASGATLDALSTEMVFRPLGLASTGFNPPASWVSRVAATEDSCQHERNLAGSEIDGYKGYRHGVVRAEVHDQNAYVLGGVAGNAGLFSTAQETAILAAEFLGERGGGRGMLDSGSRDLASHDLTPGLVEARSFAFRLALRGETAAGPDLPPQSFGHNGFTGTSVWIDPESARVYVLLTNRVHPRVVDTVDMVALRRQFHSIASAA